MKTTKEVTVIARYAHKTNGQLNGTVTYLVRASNGVDTYCTTVIEGKASGCSCPAHSKCYHKTQLESKEQGRPFAAKQFPKWAIELVKTGKLVAPGTKVATPKIATIIEQAVEATLPTPKRDMMKATLTRTAGFSLMR